MQQLTESSPNQWLTIAMVVLFHNAKKGAAGAHSASEDGKKAKYTDNEESTKVPPLKQDKCEIKFDAADSEER